MAEQEQEAVGWISTAERLPEGGQYVAFVAEGVEEVFSGQFRMGLEGGGHFQDIDGKCHWKVLRWRPDSTGLSLEEREELQASLRSLKQELRALWHHPDTMQTELLTSDVLNRMEEIRRKLGATADD